MALALLLEEGRGYDDSSPDDELKEPIDEGLWNRKISYQFVDQRTDDVTNLRQPTEERVFVTVRHVADRCWSSTGGSVLEGTLPV